MACTHAKEPPTTATSERLGTATLSGPLTTQLAVPRRYPVDVGQDFPLLSSFYTGVPTELRVAIGENFAVQLFPLKENSYGASRVRQRALRPATGPPNGRLPWSVPAARCYRTAA